MKRLASGLLLAVALFLSGPLSAHADGGHGYVRGYGGGHAWAGRGHWGAYPRHYHGYGWRPGFYWGGGIVLGSPWYPYAPWYPYGYYAPPPPVIVQQQPPVYVQPQQQQPYYWYYCQNPQGYYPYVKTCPGGWMKVVPPHAPND